MIKADLGVIQALFDLNTVFAVKQNNGHKDCSIFNLNLLRPCGQMFFFSSFFTPSPYCLFFTSRTDLSSPDLSHEYLYRSSYPLTPQVKQNYAI